jgi:hypothetical protein
MWKQKASFRYMRAAVSGLIFQRNRSSVSPLLLAEQRKRQRDISLLMPASAVEVVRQSVRRTAS